MEQNIASSGSRKETGTSKGPSRIPDPRDWWRMSSRWLRQMRSHSFWRSVLNEKTWRPKWKILKGSESDGKPSFLYYFSGVKYCGKSFYFMQLFWVRFMVFIFSAVFRIFQDISNYSRNIKSLELCNAVDGNHELQLQKYKVKRCFSVSVTIECWLQTTVSLY